MNHLIVYALAWTTSTFAEAKGDYLFEKKLRKEDFELVDLNVWKNLDSLEKGMFVLAFTGIECLAGMSWYNLIVFFFWNCWCRWLGHESWMSYFSKRSFSNPGTHSSFELFLLSKGIYGWKFVVLITLPLALMTVWLSL